MGGTDAIRVADPFLRRHPRLRRGIDGGGRGVVRLDGHGGVEHEVPVVREPVVLGGGGDDHVPERMRHHVLAPLERVHGGGQAGRRREGVLHVPLVVGRGQTGQPVVALSLVAPPRDDREGRLHPRPPEALEHGTPPQARLALVHVVAVYEDDVRTVCLGVRAHLGAVHHVLPRIDNIGHRPSRRPPDVQPPVHSVHVAEIYLRAVDDDLPSTQLDDQFDGGRDPAAGGFKEDEAVRPSLDSRLGERVAGICQRFEPRGVQGLGSATRRHGVGLDKPGSLGVGRPNGDVPSVHGNRHHGSTPDARRMETSICFAMLVAEQDEAYDLIHTATLFRANEPLSANETPPTPFVNRR